MVEGSAPPQSVLPLPPGPYRLCLMDPPWAFRTFNGKNRTPTQKSFREAEDHYLTMPIAAMAALPVGDMMARDSAIAMWVVGSHLDAALELARSWGFKFKTDLFYWAKQKLLGADQIDLFTGDIPPPRISMGYYTRKQVEPCWLFTRGRGLPVLDHGVPQMIIATSTGHSRKPAEQYARLHRLFGDVTRIEMFARNTTLGWDAWGNEVGKFDHQLAAPVPSVAGATAGLSGGGCDGWAPEGTKGAAQQLMHPLNAHPAPLDAQDLASAAAG